MVFRYEKDTDNIVTITMDMPQRSANVINAEFNAALAETFARLKAETELTGVIITSAKKTFLAGADLEPMLEVRGSGGIVSGNPAGQAHLSRHGNVWETLCRSHQWRSDGRRTGTGAGVPLPPFSLTARTRRWVCRK